MSPDALAELRRLADGLRSDLERFIFASAWRPRPFHPVLSRALDAATVIREGVRELEGLHTRRAA